MGTAGNILLWSLAFIGSVVCVREAASALTGEPTRGRSVSDCAQFTVGCVTTQNGPPVTAGPGYDFEGPL